LRWPSGNALAQHEANNLYPIYQNQKYGYIDRAGKIIVSPDYDQADFVFSEGFAAVMKGEKSGFIDSTGKHAIKLEFDSVRPFSEGLALIYKLNKDQRGFKIGYIDKAGVIIINPQFDHDDRFLSLIHPLLRQLEIAGRRREPSAKRLMLRLNRLTRHGDVS
jgi:hypothetical protein